MSQENIESAETSAYKKKRDYLPNADWQCGQRNGFSFVSIVQQTEEEGWYGCGCDETSVQTCGI